MAGVVHWIQKARDHIADSVQVYFVLQDSARNAGLRWHAPVLTAFCLAEAQTSHVSTRLLQVSSSAGSKAITDPALRALVHAASRIYLRRYVIWLQKPKASIPAQNFTSSFHSWHC